MANKNIWAEAINIINNYKVERTIFSVGGYDYLGEN